MRTGSSKYSDFLNRMFTGITVLLVASFPYSIRISSLLTFSLVVVWLMKEGYVGFILALKDKSVLVFLLLFLVSVVSLLYSESRNFFPLEKRLSFLVFPLILFKNNWNRTTIRLILYSFSASCSMGVIYSLSFGIYRNFLFNSLTSINKDFFGSDMTTDSIGISHVYFGLYLSFTIVILVYFLFVKNKHSYSSVFILALIGFLLFFMFLLGGKMSIISLFLISIIACVWFMIKSKRWILGTCFLVLPLSIFFVTINSFENARYRFEYLFIADNYYIGDNQWNSIGSRLSALKCSLAIYEQVPIVGTGIGDVQHDLDKCYDNLNYLSLKGMNPHNQYIQFLLEMGMLGLLAFISVIVYAFWWAYRMKNVLYLSFLFLFLMCCLTESLLERQQGIMFFSFFNSLFFFENEKT